MFQPDVVLYHSPCDDGSIAAMVVCKFYSQKFPKAEIQYVPANYANADVEYWTNLVREKNVLVVDFSFKGTVRTAMETACANMLILDHHASAEENYGEDVIPFAGQTIDDAEALLQDNKIVLLYATDRCGASMTWDFFYPDQERPELLDYIEDQDLGRRKLPDATAFTYWLRSRSDYHVPSNFVFLDSFEEDADFQAAINHGKAVYQYVELNLGIAAESAAIGTVSLENPNEDITIAIAFAPYQFASELANIMVETHDIQAALVFYSFPNMAMGVSIRGGKTQAGLQTSYARRIASSLGGGGHNMAAGANFKSVPDALKVVTDIMESWTTEK